MPSSAHGFGLHESRFLSFGVRYLWALRRWNPLAASGIPVAIQCSAAIDLIADESLHRSGILGYVLDQPNAYCLRAAMKAFKHENVQA
jgi:hypothetical protein